MSDKSVLLVTDTFFLKHRFSYNGESEPFETPARLFVILRSLKEQPILGVTITPPSVATHDALVRIHATSYVDHIDSMRSVGGKLSDGNTISADSVEAAYLAAGAGMKAVGALLEGTDKRAFVLGRPPGHHAEWSEAMGFCLFNNIAIAAAEALARGKKRICIVDWDVHHGNGTQHRFEDRKEVLFIDIHEHGNFPKKTGMITEIGRGDGKGYTVNVPLPAGCGNADYLQVFEQLVLPIAEQFKPELVLVSAGFDAHVGDPLGAMKLTAPGYANCCQLLCNLADRHAEGRIALFLEGGYNLEGLCDSVRACLEVLAGSKPKKIEGAVAGSTNDIIQQVKKVQAPFWKI